MTLAADSTGGYSHRQRAEAIPSGTAMTSPVTAETIPM